MTEDRAIINRLVKKKNSIIKISLFSSYGFNNDGYDAVRARLIDYRQRTNANKDSKNIQIQ